MTYVYGACTIRATIFSAGDKFELVSNLHVLTLAARSYALLLILRAGWLVRLTQGSLCL